MIQLPLHVVVWDASNRQEHVTHKLERFIWLSKKKEEFFFSLMVILCLFSNSQKKMKWKKKKNMTFYGNWRREKHRWTTYGQIYSMKHFKKSHLKYGSFAIISGIIFDKMFLHFDLCDGTFSGKYTHIFLSFHFFFFFFIHLNELSKQQQHQQQTSNDRPWDKKKEKRKKEQIKCRRKSLWKQNS